MFLSGPSTAEILNFEKNLERSIDYDPELQILERGRNNGDHNYLKFNTHPNGGKVVQYPGETGVSIQKGDERYGELSKLGEQIEQIDKQVFCLSMFF